MAFQSMLSGAECSTSNNHLSQFLKHTETDRSLQHDAMHGAPGVQQRPGFRTRPGARGVGGVGGVGQDMDAFVRQQAAPGTPHFDMHAMRTEMDAMHARMQPGAPGALARPPPSASSWADEMQRGAQPVRGGHAAWSEQFHSSPPVASAQRESAPMRPGMGMYGGMSGMGMGGLGMGSMGMGMGMNSYMGARAGSMQRPTERTSQQDARIVELDNAKWDEQFRKMEAQAEAESATVDKGKQREAQLDEQAELNELREMEARLRDEVQDTNPRFEELWNALKDPSLLDKQDELAKWEKELMEAVAAEDPLQSTHPGGGLGHGVHGLAEEDGLGEVEARLRRELNDVDAAGFPNLKPYEYETENPFAGHAAPYAEGMRLLEHNGSLSDAALLFEVATQQSNSGRVSDEIDLSRAEQSRAWQRLGECHAMNEHEEKAIQALEEAVRIDSTNLEAHLALAVAYVNEGYDQAANETLLRYMARSHPHIAPTAEFPALPNASTNPWAKVNYVRELFLKAAREDAARGTMDPEIQMGLGLLFYSTYSYDQAKDCFQAALESRPNDCQLWNRLGATLANGGNPELATDAYHRALELRPSFTRAIYNLSVSCLSLGAHHEAAEHLLSALALQRTQSVPDVPNGTTMPPPLSHAKESEGLWNTLRSIMVVMERMDLVGQCHVGSDLETFRRAGFEF